MAVYPLGAAVMSPVRVSRQLSRAGPRLINLRWRASVNSSTGTGTRSAALVPRWFMVPRRC